VESETVQKEMKEKKRNFKAGDKIVSCQVGEGVNVVYWGAEEA